MKKAILIPLILSNLNTNTNSLSRLKIMKETPRVEIIYKTASRDLKKYLNNETSIKLIKDAILKHEWTKVARAKLILGSLDIPRNADGETILMQIAKLGKYEEAMRLIGEYGADIKIVNKYDIPVLYGAIEGPNEKLAIEIYKMDPNLLDRGEYTPPLSLAAELNRIEFLKYVVTHEHIQLGRRYNKEKYLEDPLTEAINNNHFEAFKLLLWTKEFDIFKPKGSGLTICDLAIIAENHKFKNEIIKYIKTLPQDNKLKHKVDRCMEEYF